jgi:hypothetical protein
MPPSVLQRSHALLLGLLLAGAGLAIGSAGRAQDVIPKLQAHCPLGYVDTFNGKCSSQGMTTSRMVPARRDACPPGFVPVGGGYCRKN